MHQNNQLQLAILSNFSNIVTIRLDDTNYVSWRFMMESMLIGCDLMGYIDGSVPCPPQYKTTTEAGITELTEEYKEWRKNDSALITVLAATLSSNALSFIVGSRSSKEVWLSLEERYGKLPKYKAYELKISMQQIQKGNDSIDKYMERFKTIRDRLSVAGVFISDEDITYLVLHGLPSEYATMKTIIRMKTLSSSVSMAELRSLLLIAEYEIEQTVKSILERSKTEMVAHGDSFRSENFVVQGTQFGGAGLPKGMYDASGSSYSSSTAQAGHAPSSAMNGNAYRPPASSGSQNGYVPTSTTMAANTGFVNSSIVPHFDINSTLQPLRHHQLVTQMGVSPHANFMSQAASYVKAFNTMDSTGSLSPSTNSGPQMQSNEPSTTLNHSFSPSSSGSMSIHPHTNGISPANGSFFSQKNRSSIVVCYFCGKRGHCAYRCGYRKSQLLNFPSSSFIECQICKRKGHSAKSCYYIQPQVMANSFSSPPGLWNSLSYVNTSQYLPLIPPG